MSLDGGMSGATSAQPEAGAVSPSGRSLRGSHQLAASTVCERLWDLRYNKRFVLIAEKEHRLRGTLAHLALAYHNASRMAPPPAWFYEKDLVTALEEKGQGLPDGIRCAQEILLAYRQEYAHDPWTPVAVEDEFLATCATIDPIDLAAEPSPSVRAHLEHLKTFDDDMISCRPDLLVRIGREIWIVDHKTVGQSWGRKRGLAVWHDEGEYALNWQVLVNLHVVRANIDRLGGLPVRGFIIQRITREPDASGRYFFDRHILSVPRRAYEIAPRVARTAVAREAAIRASMAAGVAPTPSYWACWGRYGECDYRPVCMARDTETALTILQRDYRREG